MRRTHRRTRAAPGLDRAHHGARAGCDTHLRSSDRASPHPSTIYHLRSVLVQGGTETTGTMSMRLRVRTTVVTGGIRNTDCDRDRRPFVGEESYRDDEENRERMMTTRKMKMKTMLMTAVRILNDFPQCSLLLSCIHSRLIASRSIRPDYSNNCNSYRRVAISIQRSSKQRYN